MAHWLSTLVHSPAPKIKHPIVQILSGNLIGKMNKSMKNLFSSIKVFLAMLISSGNRMAAKEPRSIGQIPRPIQFRVANVDEERDSGINHPVPNRENYFLMLKDRPRIHLIIVAELVTGEEEAAMISFW